MPLFVLLVLSLPPPCTDTSSCQAECDQDVAASCRKLGELLLQLEPAQRDDARAAQLARKSCDLKDPAGCVLLAQLYQRGTGVAEDLPQAFALYEQACGKRIYAGCAGAGSFYAEGKAGVPKNERKAKRLWEIGCRGGAKTSCVKLAQLFSARRDQPRSLRYFEKACEFGDAPSCSSASATYWRGDGVRRDPDRGVTFARRACLLGGQTSCEFLTTMGK